MVVDSAVDMSATFFITLDDLCTPIVFDVAMVVDSAVDMSATVVITLDDLCTANLTDRAKASQPAATHKPYAMSARASAPSQSPHTHIAVVSTGYSHEHFC